MSQKIYKTNEIQKLRRYPQPLYYFYIDNGFSNSVSVVQTSTGIIQQLTKQILMIQALLTLNPSDVFGPFFVQHFSQYTNIHVHSFVRVFVECRESTKDRLSVTQKIGKT